MEGTGKNAAATEANDFGDDEIDHQLTVNSLSGLLPFYTERVANNKGKAQNRLQIKVS